MQIFFPECPLTVYSSCKFVAFRDFLKVEVPDAYDSDQVKIVWIGGKRAVMTVYNCKEMTDDCQVENVELFDYDFRRQMHEMMVQKGFEFKEGKKEKYLGMFWSFVSV